MDGSIAKHAACLLAVAALPVVPWLARNMYCFDRPFLTRSVGRQLWDSCFLGEHDGRWLNPTLEFAEDAPTTARVFDELQGRGVPMNDYSAVYQGLHGLGYSESEIEDLMAGVSREAIQSQWPRFAVSRAYRCLLFWITSEEVFHWRYDNIERDETGRIVAGEVAIGFTLGNREPAATYAGQETWCCPPAAEPLDAFLRRHLASVALPLRPGRAGDAMGHDPDDPRPAAADSRHRPGPADALLHGRHRHPRAPHVPLPHDPRTADDRGRDVGALYRGRSPGLSQGNVAVDCAVRLRVFGCVGICAVTHRPCYENESDTSYGDPDSYQHCEKAHENTPDLLGMDVAKNAMLREHPEIGERTADCSADDCGREQFLVQDPDRGETGRLWRREVQEKDDSHRKPDASPDHPNEQADTERIDQSPDGLVVDLRIVCRPPRPTSSPCAAHWLRRVTRGIDPVDQFRQRERGERFGRKSAALKIGSQ